MSSSTMRLARREDLVYCIENRTEGSDGAINDVRALDSDEHAAPALPERSPLVPKRPERSVQSIRHHARRDGACAERCDAGRTGAVLH